MDRNSDEHTCSFVNITQTLDTSMSAQNSHNSENSDDFIHVERVDNTENTSGDIPSSVNERSQDGISVAEINCIGNNEGSCNSIDPHSSLDGRTMTFASMGPEALSSNLCANDSESFQELNYDSETEAKELVSAHVNPSDSGCPENIGGMLRSSVGSLSVSGSSHSTFPDFNCDFCDLIDKSLESSPESVEFWKKIQPKGLDETRCHTKFMVQFLDELMKYANDDELKQDTTCIAFLKMLLKVHLTDETATVEYKDFCRIVKFLGPVKQNDCVLLKQIRSLRNAAKPKSSDRHCREKVSWFAGDMSREEAENRLTKERHGTFLVRMSQTSGDHFVISVKNCDDIEHFEVEADVEKALKSDPYHAHLELNGNSFASLVEAISYIRSNPLKSDSEESDAEDIYCRYPCPDLPFNRIFSGYRKTSKRK